jgi:putative nucleotidyltransferase with HDIG domain
VQAKDLVSSSVRLLSLPRAYFELQRLLDSGDASSATIAHCLRNDPALTAQVLRIANSCMYGLSSRVDTISRAVTVIGNDAIYNLVLATSAVGIFSKKKLPYFNIKEYWEHSLRTGLMAQKIAGQCNVLHTESYFIGGLLHDIGTMLIAMKLPELARTLYMRFPDEAGSKQDTEMQVLGFTHADVGGELLASWLLPPHLVEAVRYHHTPEQAPGSPLSAAITQIACAYVEDSSHNHHRLEQMVDPFSWQISGIFPDQLAGIQAEVDAMFEETFSLFFGRAA